MTLWHFGSMFPNFSIRKQGENCDSDAICAGWWTLWIRISAQGPHRFRSPTHLPPNCHGCLLLPQGEPSIRDTNKPTIPPKNDYTYTKSQKHEILAKKRPHHPHHQYLSRNAKCQPVVAMFFSLPLSLAFHLHPQLRKEFFPPPLPVFSRKCNEDLRIGRGMPSGGWAEKICRRYRNSLLREGDEKKTTKKILKGHDSCGIEIGFFFLPC